MLVTPDLEIYEPFVVFFSSASYVEDTTLDKELNNTASVAKPLPINLPLKSRSISFNLSTPVVLLSSTSFRVKFLYSSCFRSSSNISLAVNILTEEPNFNHAFLLFWICRKSTDLVLSPKPLPAICWRILI